MCPSSCVLQKGFLCPQYLEVGQAQLENGSHPEDPPGHCHRRSCSSCSDCPQGNAPFPAGVGAVEVVVVAAAAAVAAAAESLMGSFDPGEVKLALT